MQTFNVFINTGSNRFEDHTVHVEARSHDEALEMALLVADLPFDAVVSAVITPQTEVN